MPPARRFRWLERKRPPFGAGGRRLELSGRSANLDRVESLLGVSLLCPALRFLLRHWDGGNVVGPEPRSARMPTR